MLMVLSGKVKMCPVWPVPLSVSPGLGSFHTGTDTGTPPQRQVGGCRVLLASQVRYLELQKASIKFLRRAHSFRELEIIAFQIIRTALLLLGETLG